MILQLWPRFISFGFMTRQARRKARPCPTAYQLRESASIGTCIIASTLNFPWNLGYFKLKPFAKPSQEQIFTNSAAL
jgi:hypothetical protein